MGFDSLIRSGIVLADSLTKKGLQATVSHSAFASQNSYGEATYGTAVSRRAVVSDSTELIKDDQGREALARYRVLFLGAVTVSVRDKLTINGRVSPILRVDAGVLADDGAQFVTEVFCG